MHIILGVKRQVEIDHRRQFGDIQAARRHIRCNQSFNCALLECIQRLHAFTLRFIAMNGGGVDAATRELPRQPACTALLLQKIMTCFSPRKRISRAAASALSFSSISYTSWRTLTAVALRVSISIETGSFK